MPRPGAVLRAAVAGAAAVVVLAACGGGGGSNNNASSSSSASTSSSAAATSSTPAGGGGGAFCAQAQQFVSQVQGLAADQNNPDLGATLTQLAGQLQQITPPPPIASDWQTAVSAIGQLGQLYTGTNLNDPQQVQALAQKAQPLVQQLEASGTHIEAYLSQQCGINTSESSAPSS